MEIGKKRGSNSIDDDDGGEFIIGDGAEGGRLLLKVI